MLDFLLSDIFLLEADMLLVPVSTAGTISNSFESGLQKLGVKLDKKSRFQLGDIRAVSSKKANRFKQIILVCSVDEQYSTYSAIRKIGLEIGGLITSDIRSVASPIIGSGAGGLSPINALNIMRTAFYETAPNSADITFCTMDNHVRDMFESVLLDTERPSAQLVIEADLEIREFPHIQEIINYQEFYYKLAKDKWDELKGYNNEQAFFRSLLESFTKSKIPYQQFLRSLDENSDEYRFVKLCGELISYIDFNAYNKSKWNQYPDKRVLAKSGVNQSLWLKNLIKFKLRGIEGLDGQSVKNALSYLEEPSIHLSMLSEEHRRKVFANMLLQPYQKEEGLEPIFAFFNQLGFRTISPENNTALISRLLYLPQIKRLWNGEQDSHDSDALITTIKENELFLAKSLIEQCLEDNLIALDLGNCGIKDLDDLPELFDCIHLEELTLSNQWAEYKSGGWRECYSENSGNPNILSSIPSAISKLQNLKLFRCGGNWWTDDHTHRWSISNIKPISELLNLEYLNLSNNLISSIAPLVKLKDLVELHLNNNKIANIQPLVAISSLRYAYLSNNSIRSVKGLEQVSWLNTLDLHTNSIQDLSSLELLISKIGIKNSSWSMGTISIGNNPLTLPSMPIVNISPEAVLQTIRDIKEGGHYINTDIKIILIGNSETGKSTLTKYLNNEKDLDVPHAATLWLDECIVRSKYKIDKIGKYCDLHIFDFGGHDFYHDTHHIFYSINTLYVLLWQKELERFNTRLLKQTDKKGRVREFATQDYPISYWLDSVRYYTKIQASDNLTFKTSKPETYSSPLLVIQTNVKNANDIKHRDQEKLVDNYAFIQDFLNISIRDPQRHMGHFDMVFLEALNDMQIIGEKLPIFYRTIRQAIETYKGKPVLDQHEFLEFCNTLGGTVITAEQASVALSYFEQIGLLLCSRHNVKQKIYINKEWVINQMQNLLDGLVEKRGEFTAQEALQNIDGDESTLEDMIALMMEYKIIFKHPLLNQTYVAPLYLPAMPSDKISLFLNQNIKPFRRFEYKGYIQKNLILSVFQKYGAQLKQGDSTHHYYWKDALILKAPQKDEIVLVKFFFGDDKGNSRIDIFNLKSDSQPTFIHDVIATIRLLSDEYDADEMVSNDGTDFVSIKVLEENAKLGKWVFTERKLSDRKKVAPAQKLLMLKDFTMYTGPITKKKVVISYSKKDLTQIHTLIRYLQPLVADNLIEEPWYCTNLLPGDDWDEKIKTKFEEADIIFFMISEYFYATKYIEEHEVKNAINRYNNGSKIKIVPIVLEFYDWRRSGTYNLQNFSALPYQLKPISDFLNPKIAWSTITTSVRAMIEKDLDPGKQDIVSRDVQEILERQVAGKLDRNS